VLFSQVTAGTSAFSGSHFVASLEVPNRPVGQFTFLLLAALIERTGSIVCRVELVTSN